MKRSHAHCAGTFNIIGKRIPDHEGLVRGGPDDCKRAFVALRVRLGGPQARGGQQLHS